MDYIDSLSIMGRSRAKGRGKVTTHTRYRNINSVASASTIERGRGRANFIEVSPRAASREEGNLTAVPAVDYLIYQNKKRIVRDIFTKACVDFSIGGRWALKFVDDFSRAGATNFADHSVLISNQFLVCETSTITNIREIVLHEIAHVIAGSSAGHGEAWLHVARSIGCGGRINCDKFV